jgi:hypothetical protein
MGKVNLSIAVSDEHSHKFSNIVKKMKKAGLKVDEEMEGLGIVTGSIDSAKVDSLRDLEGVKHVEEQRNVHIPPPESSVQ